ncbi:hypothetical protein BJX62DRAFT_196661 [Aspergillus germanicus]
MEYTCTDHEEEEAIEHLRRHHASFIHRPRRLGHIWYCFDCESKYLNVAPVLDELEKED